MRPWLFDVLSLDFTATLQPAVDDLPREHSQSLPRIEDAGTGRGLALMDDVAATTSIVCHGG